jgi:hypothetical protein
MGCFDVRFPHGAGNGVLGNKKEMEEKLCENLLCLSAESEFMLHA